MFSNNDPNATRAANQSNHRKRGRITDGDHNGPPVQAPRHEPPAHGRSPRSRSQRPQISAAGDQGHDAAAMTPALLCTAAVNVDTPRRAGVHGDGPTMSPGALAYIAITRYVTATFGFLVRGPEADQ